MDFKNINIKFRNYLYILKTQWIDDIVDQRRREFINWNIALRKLPQTTEKRRSQI